MHLKSLCIPAALACLLAQQVTARNIFVTPGETSGSDISTFTADPFSFAATLGPVVGGFTVVGSTSPTKHYVVSRSNTDAVTILQGRFPLVTPGTRLSLGGTPSAAVLTPDGRFLVVAGQAGVAIIDTEADRVTSLMGNIDVGAASDIASGIDGARVYVLSTSGSRLTAVNVAARQPAGNVSLPNTPTAVATGPNGVVYVSAQNTIYELDPGTLAIRAAIAVNGNPGKLQFTPNGQFALAPSTAAAGGRGAFLLNLTTRAVTDISNAVYSLSDVALVGNDLAYGITPQGQTYVLAIGSDGTLTASAASFTGSAVTGPIEEIAATGEIPNASYLILAADEYLYRVQVDNRQAVEPVRKPHPGNLTLVTSQGQSAAAGHLAYNTTQTAASGTASLPLVVRAYDSSGLPAVTVPVTFSTTAPGITLQNANVTTNLEGYASVVVNVPASMTSGSIPVTASIQGGQRSASFTVTVGDPNLPGPGTGPGPGGPSVPTGLQIVSGHGQAVSEQFSTSSPLRVRLTDSRGQPVSDAQINWSVVSGAGNIGQGTTTTNSDGETTNSFIAAGLNPGVPHQLNIVRTTAPDGQSVELYVVSLPLLSGQLGPGAIDPQWVTPQNITLRAGEPLQGAIQARASVRGTSFPAPNIGLRIVQTDLNAPMVQCRGGIVLTDQQGLASCDLIANRAFSQPFSITAVLGEVAQQTFQVTVEQGAPAQVRIINGNNQTLLQGQTTQPLIVEVRDAAGAVMPNVSVAWDYPFFFPTPSSIQRTTDARGRAQASFTLPADRSGTFNVRVSAGNGSASFTITANVAASGINPVSGGDQSAVVGQAFAQPLQVRVTNAEGTGVANALVTFAVTSGTATLNPASANTNSEGIASTTVTAGNTAGPVVITATSGNQNTTFNLTVRLSGPVFTANDVLNAAGFLPGISPGGIAYIRAAGIATELRGSMTPSAVVGPLPTTLNNVEVLFNDIAAPVYAVSNVNGEESVIVQVPFEVQPGTVNATIRSTGGGTTTVPVQVLPVKPGVFTYRDTNGTVYAVATRPDGSYISAANPARRGEEIRVYAAGLGQTAPATATNRAGLGGQQVAAAVIGGINNAGVRVRSAELLEGSVGVYVVTLEIPADTAAGGNQPIGLGVTGPDGEVVFANSTFIPIQ